MSQLHDHPVVFATMRLARRGLNRPDIDTLFLVSPFKSAADYQQGSGRALRELEGEGGRVLFDEIKDPVIVFFEDDIGVCRHAGVVLRQHARKHGHKIRILE